jgi:enoyl-CoA hydratase/carnithine racemase
MRVQHEHDGPAVLRVRLTPDERGEVRIDPAATAGLRAALEEAEADPRCRVILLEGTPGTFCLGLSFAEGGEATPATEVAAFAEVLASLRRTGRLVIAAVDGAAVGGGVALAAAADIAVATARSSFGLPEVVLGILPAIVLPVLLERMPPQRARLVALGGTIDAQRALELGLVDRLVADEPALAGAVRGLLRQALRLHPGALLGLKRLCAVIQGEACERALQIGAAESARLLADPQRIAAIRAFEAGEPLPWFERYGATARKEEG